MDNSSEGNSSSCLNLTDAELETYQMFQWWVADVLERFIGVAGLIANVTAIIVLSHKRMASNFNYLLMFLALCDMAIILLTLVEDFQNKSVCFYFILEGRFYFFKVLILLNHHHSLKAFLPR